MEGPACVSASRQAAPDCCWVCLGEATYLEPLLCPCQCPRPVHAHCLARWQLHSAGSREETTCRFCEGPLPDWKPVLTPSCAAPPAAAAATMPTMSVTFNGTVHHVAVQGGPHGYACFIRDIRQIFGITDAHEMQLCFDCADPVTGQLVKLNGSGAYQAAVHCATISAVKRLHGQSRQQFSKPARLGGSSGEGAQRPCPLGPCGSLPSPLGALAPITPPQRPATLGFAMDSDDCESADSGGGSEGEGSSDGAESAAESTGSSC